MTDSETPVNETTTANEPGVPEDTTTPADEGTGLAVEELPEVSKPPAGSIFWGTGRRKSAVARVRLLPGEGKIVINERGVDEYFREPEERLAVREALMATNTEGTFNAFVNVGGGGHSGQAEAIRLGIARALLKADPRHEPKLREKGYLTRDARVVERKKYGQRKARRRFQFSKR